MTVLRGAVLTAAGVLVVQVLVAVGLSPLLAGTGAGPGALLVFGVVVAALLRVLLGMLVARRLRGAEATWREVWQATAAGAAAGYLPLAVLEYWDQAAFRPLTGLLWLILGLAVTVGTILLGVWWRQRRVP
jgi:hypothetical protein